MARRAICCLILLLATSAFGLEITFDQDSMGRVLNLASTPAGWTVVANPDGSYLLKPPAPWVVAVNGVSLTRPVYDKALYLTGVKKEVARVEIGATCGPAVGTSLNYREVPGGVAYCTQK